MRSRAGLTLLFAVGLGAAALAFMTVDQRYVAAPALVCITMVTWLWMTLWDRDQRIPFFDVGMLCAISTAIYTVYPLLNYWMDDLQFGVLSDYRLQNKHISPSELGVFHLRHVLYLFAFVISYSGFRGKGLLMVGNVRPPRKLTRLAIVLIFLILSGYMLLLWRLTGMNYGTSYEAEAYANNLAAFTQAPLLLVQISGRLAGVLFLSKLGLLFLVVGRFRNNRLLAILFFWITAEIIQVLYIRGARTGLVLFLMATALFYHRMVKPFSPKLLIPGGAVLFLFFIFMGIYRGHLDLGETRQTLSQTDSGIFSANNEFQALLGTAYDVHLLKKEGVELPWSLYANDFINILPPQQLLPFEKVPAAQWYLRQIGMDGTGVGFMWGVISQSIVGLDWIELAIRGALLGCILALFHRWYLRHQSGFLESVLYILMCLNVYYTFRDTTFSPLANIVWQFIPFYIIMRLCGEKAMFAPRTHVLTGAKTCSSGERI